MNDFIKKEVWTMSKTLEIIFKTNLNKTAKLQLPQISATITEDNVQ